MKAYKVNNFGDKAALQLVEIDIPKPKENEILIKHNYISINHCDIHARKGLNPYIKSPFIPGYEGFGIIEAIGEKVTGESLKIGDLVGYTTANGGAYAEYNCLHQDLVVGLNGNAALIAAYFSKALTAHYLMTRLVKLRINQYVLVHGAAGGVGHIMVQMAKYYGLNVIATVLNDQQANFLQSLGIKHVINNSKQDFVAETMKITNNFGVDAAYDLLGGEYLTRSLKCANYFGIVSSVGDIFSKPQNFDIGLLNEKCLFLSKPRFEIYRGMRMELVLSTNEIMTMLDQQFITPAGTAYEFSQIPEVQQQMEQFGSIGSQLIEF